MRGPVVAYASRRWRASKIASRVFSLAHTAVSPAAPISIPFICPCDASASFAAGVD